MQHPFEANGSSDSSSSSDFRTQGIVDALLLRLPPDVAVEMLRARPAPQFDAIVEQQQVSFSPVDYGFHGMVPVYEQASSSSLSLTVVGDSNNEPYYPLQSPLSAEFVSRNELSVECCERTCDIVACGERFATCSTVAVLRHKGKIHAVIGETSQGKPILGDRVADNTACKLTEHYMNCHENEAHRKCSKCKKSAGYVCLLSHPKSTCPPSKHLCSRCTASSKQPTRGGATKFVKGETSRVSNLQQHLAGSAHCGSNHYTCFLCGPEAGSFVTSSDFSIHCKSDVHLSRSEGVQVEEPAADCESAVPARSRRSRGALLSRGSSGSIGTTEFTGSPTSPNSSRSSPVLTEIAPLILSMTPQWPENVNTQQVFASPTTTNWAEPSMAPFPQQPNTYYHPQTPPLPPFAPQTLPLAQQWSTQQEFIPAMTTSTRQSTDLDLTAPIQHSETTLSSLQREDEQPKMVTTGTTDKFPSSLLAKSYTAIWEEVVGSG